MTFVMPNNWLQRTALRAAAEPSYASIVKDGKIYMDTLK
jgi:hypothetical protein